MFANSLKSASLLSVLCVALPAFAADAPQQDAPKSILFGSQSSFANTVDGLTAASSTILRTRRTEVRLGSIRRVLALTLLPQSAEKAKDEGHIFAALKDGDIHYKKKSDWDLYKFVLICRPRAAQAVAAARNNMLAKIASGLKSMGQEVKIANFADAFKALSDTPSIDAKTEVKEAKIEEDELKHCFEDQKSDFYSGIYGVEGFPEAGPGFVAALLGLWDIFKGIFEPIVTETARAIEVKERRDAIRKFLTNEKNAKAIAAAVDDMRNLLLASAKAKKDRALFELTSALDALRVALPSARSVAECKDKSFADKDITVDLGQDRQFEACFRAAWGTLEKPLKRFLEAAAAYDEISDADFDKGQYDKYKKLTDYKFIVSIGNASPEGDELKNLFDSVLSALTFASKVEKAFSADSRDKIRKSVDEVVAAVGGN
jgi:hypothetical protein